MRGVALWHLSHWNEAKYQLGKVYAVPHEGFYEVSGPEALLGWSNCVARPLRVAGRVFFKKAVTFHTWRPYNWCMKIQALLSISLLAALGLTLFYQQENSKLETEIRELREQSNTSTHSTKGSQDKENRKSARNTTSRDRGSVRDLLAVENPSDRITALLEFAESLNPGDIPDALKKIREASPHWDPEAKMIAHILLTRWAIDDPEGALASLKGIDLMKFGSDPMSVLSGVASVDPDIAAAWLKDPDNSMMRVPFMGQFLAGSVSKEWGRNDPDAALAWAESLPDSQKTGAITGILGSLASTDPSQAASLAMDLAPGESREYIVGEIARSWAEKNPTSALAWADNLEGTERQMALRNGIGELARNDLEGAVSYLDGLEAEERNALLDTVTKPWAQEDPAEAADWVVENTAEPDSQEAGGRALGDVLYEWTLQDPQAAGTWLNEQERTPALDGAITGLARASFEDDPEGSLTWATQISNDGLRDLSIGVGLGAWMQRDRAAATNWARENEIPLPGGNEE